MTVWLHGGTYRVSNAITFTSADSGKNGHVTHIRPFPGEVPVISGGTPITGWTIYDAQKNIYVADVPAAAVNSRQFYVDGEHQTRAMTEQSPTDWTLFGTKGYMSPAVTTQEANEYLVLDLGKVRSVNYLTAYSSIQGGIKTAVGRNFRRTLQLKPQRMAQLGRCSVNKPDMSRLWLLPLQHSTLHRLRHAILS